MIDVVGGESSACKMEENAYMGRSFAVLDIFHVGHPQDFSLAQASPFRRYAQFLRYPAFSSFLFLLILHAFLFVVLMVLSNFVFWVLIRSA